MSRAEGERAWFPFGEPGSRARDRLRPLARKFLLARDPGSAAIQSVVLQLLTVCANLVTGVVTARLLGAEGRGVYAAATSWPTMLGAVAVAGIVDAILMQIRRKPQWTLATVTWAGAAAMASATVITVIAYLGMPILLGPRHAEAVPLARTALLLTHVIASGAIWRYVFSGRGQFLLANLASFLPHLIHAAAICALALTGRLTVATAIAGLGVGVIGAQLLLLPFIVKAVRGPWEAARASGTAMLTFALRATPADLLAICCDWADRLLLILLLTPRDLGLYTVAYGFSRAVALITPDTGLLLSVLARTDRSEAKQLHDLSLRLCIAALSVATAVAFVASAPLIQLFYGGGFLAAATTFKILVLQAGAARVGNVTAQFYLACNRPGLLSGFALINVVVSATLMLVMTPIYGVVGAALGLLGGTLVRLVLLWTGVPLHLGVAPPRLWPRLSDLREARVMFKS
jgi:O-antigen/teichoic acid export membrane protein